MDVDAEIREYQWRRKFESGPRRTSRTLLILAILLVTVIAIARSVSWL
jgi:hypothetical protein